ncbi:SMC-Scp complex subunit ScpB [Tissierella sp. Yu-01]|uniref:SMC-Scp complex subunit ScpB n=1 Tax=Tissierella sp. Yu-01 TaxID=3035694 RepID=UPI00240D10C4|nr:SMC-Scp complex subunit ScpB [Tissierella sp. Yu-01]WFA09710.1 SMC-Scp complex subunit ScpB [Tissierella sp. Yu-01]
MDKKEIKSIVEGLLFAWGDPLDIKDISNVLQINEKELSTIMKEIIDDFDYNRRGLRIIKFNNFYQIGTRPEHYEWIKKLNNKKNTKNLSNASLETLSIIAYKQPIIKSDIEVIRGVRSDRAIETLIDKRLVKEVGRLDRTGRPILYGTTEDFLKYFGLESLDDLPPIEEFQIESTDDDSQ